MWNLNFLTSDQTDTLYIGKQNLNHWTAREVPTDFFFFLMPWFLNLLNQDFNST